MMRSRWAAVGCCFLAALIVSPGWAAEPKGPIPPQPGTINYIEGQASIGAQSLTDKSVGSATLEAGQSLTTENGRAEVLLTPGIFLRVGDNSSVRMINPGLADTVVGLDKGRAMVEVTKIRPQNNVRIEEHGANVQVLKAGLYDFDADRAQIRVFDGQAKVDVNDQQVKVKGGHELDLAGGKLKAQEFNKKALSKILMRDSRFEASEE